MAKSDSLQRLRNKRKANHKMLTNANNSTKLKDESGKQVIFIKDIQSIGKTFADIKERGLGGTKTTFSEANAKKASSCTKQRGVLYKTKEVKPKMKFAKMPRKMKKQVKKELLAAA